MIQRGNNRQACFFADEDYLAYLGWLEEYAREGDCAIHAYVLMTNHVHLLLTNSTASRLVFTPVSFRASFIRVSSITMFVLMAARQGVYNDFIIHIKALTTVVVGRSARQAVTSRFDELRRKMTGRGGSLAPVV
jgi:REP element-mobilizing transposase RayT